MHLFLSIDTVYIDSDFEGQKIDFLLMSGQGEYVLLDFKSYNNQSKKEDVDELAQMERPFLPSKR